MTKSKPVRKFKRVKKQRRKPLSYDEVVMWWCADCKKTFEPNTGMDEMPSECPYCARRDVFREGVPYEGQDLQK
jgi:DNA-directed RNA polymerase subunit RPC12/RpoP